MLTGISVGKAKKSKVKRLPWLPRVGVSVDVLGKKFEYRQAPLQELLYNMYKDGFNKENFFRIVSAQFSEIDFKKLDMKSDMAEQNSDGKKENDQNASN